jgi:hypothetical protein
MATRKVTKRSKAAPAGKSKPASASKAKPVKSPAKPNVDPFERALAVIGTTPRKDVPSNIDRQTREQSGLQSLRKRLKATDDKRGSTDRARQHKRAHALDALNAAYARLLGG